jgi:hypothetical protein
MTEASQVESDSPQDQARREGKLPLTGVIEIKYARDGLGILGIFGSIFIVAGVFDVVSAHDVPHRLIGYAGIAFFGACLISVLWRLLNSSAAVITISPDGIRDTRIAAQFIPWDAITRISARSYGIGMTSMVLVLKSGATEQLLLTRLARLTRIPNRFFGIDGLAVVGGIALKTDFRTLLQTTLAYARAYNPRFH